MSGKVSRAVGRAAPCLSPQETVGGGQLSRNQPEAEAGKNDESPPRFDASFASMRLKSLRLALLLKIRKIRISRLV
jgi:hypothetical protein